MEYGENELEQLHTQLYDILAEIIRVCEVLGIPYFVQGGSGIGIHFFEGIIPWDDDIDIGMVRSDYERFLREAPAVLAQGYTLQWPGNEAHTPFYFAKVRRDNTAFVESVAKGLKMHHGIYVDIFPYDKTPDTPWLERLHRKMVRNLINWYMGKEVWMWNRYHRCEIDTPAEQGRVSCLLTYMARLVLPKMTIYRLLRAVQGMFNSGNHKYYNIVCMPRDHIEVRCIEHPERRRFGPLEVWAPSDLETYLRRHYPRLRKWIPEEERVTHRPVHLSFDSSWMPDF